MKRVFSFLMAALLLVSMLSALGVHAEPSSTSVSGYSQEIAEAGRQQVAQKGYPSFTAYMEGYQSAEDQAAYLAENRNATIESFAELTALAEAVNGGVGFSGVSFYQIADITGPALAEGESGNFTPIGNTQGQATPFRGIYDGQGYVIDNLTVSNGTNCTGLFGCINAGTLRNIVLGESVSIYSSSGGIGGLVGRTAGTCAISNIHSQATVGGAGNIGGIAGIVGASATVEHCTNEGSVDVPQASGVNLAGGIIGNCSSSASEISVIGCVNKADVSANQSVGGVIGANNSNTTVSGSINTGAISALANRAGGIIGGNTNGIVTVSGCENHGSVFSAKPYNDSSKGDVSAGGILGHYVPVADKAVTLEDCINTGTVTADGCAGAALGFYAWATGVTSPIYINGFVNYGEISNRNPDTKTTYPFCGFNSRNEANVVVNEDSVAMANSKVIFSQTTKLTDGAVGVRFIAAVNDATWREIGFRVTEPATGKAWEGRTTVVYRSLSTHYGTEALSITDEAVAAANDPYAECIGLSVFTLTGIPMESGSTRTFEVTVFGVLEDGTVIDGNAATVTLTEAELDRA